MSTIGPEQLEAGFVREEDSSPLCQGPSKACIRPLLSVPAANIGQIKTLVRTTGVEIDFPETISYCLSCDASVIQINSLYSCLCRWSQTITQVGKSDVAILSWCRSTWSAGMWLISSCTKLSKAVSQAADGGEMNLALHSNSSY